MKKPITKILLYASYIVVIFFFLALFGSAVRHIEKGGSKLGIFTEPLNNLTNFPNLFKDAIHSNDLYGVPPTYIEKDKGFQEINHLSSNVYALNAHFVNKPYRHWDVRLFNFRNDSVHYHWKIGPEILDWKKNCSRFLHSTVRSCILLPQRNLVAYIDETQSLFRLDQNSEVVWSNNSYQFHHTMNLDADNNLWVCSSQVGELINKNDSEPTKYRDDCITKIDLETGKVLFHKSLTEICLENDLTYLSFGQSNGLQGGSDPFHLNDIEPVIEDGLIWKKGDLLLSLRHRSTILLYRPSTGKVLKVINGKFLNQHDVDILTDSTIAIFNNNVSTIGFGSTPFFSKEFDDPKVSVDLGYSRIVIYNILNGNSSLFLEVSIEDEEIYTHSEGEVEFLNNGLVYVENQNDGRMYFFNQDGEVVMRKYFHTPYKNNVELPHWIRFYSSIDF
jgi:hypothetical protein